MQGNSKQGDSKQNVSKRLLKIEQKLRKYVDTNFTNVIQVISKRLFRENIQVFMKF